MAQGSRAGSIHVQVQLLIKPPTEKPILSRSASAGKPKEPATGATQALALLSDAGSLRG